MNQLFRAISTASVIGLSGIFSPSLLADALSNGEGNLSASHLEAKKSQQRIDSAEVTTRDVREEYLSNERMSDVTEAYNKQIALLVESQQRELSDLSAQLKSIDELDRAVLPMLNQMVDRLKRFVSADLPFLDDERQKRLTKLDALLLRADVSVAEKYRQILEAYMVEVQYGRTFEAYSGRLTQDHSNRQVNFLRLGRTALYYQTLGGKESGLWLPSEQRWQTLSEQQNLSLRRAIQVALKQKVPSLLNLPLPKLESHS